VFDFLIGVRLDITFFFIHSFSNIAILKFNASINSM